jgi:tripartite-type tricarboxylate transporter receptor subunit TctC
MRAFLFLALLAGAVQAQAQVPTQVPGYPAKPIRMVVGFPPGGGTDVVARILSPRMSELLGQPVVIENRPGATGTMAAGQVAKSPPDGYTIMMGHVSVNAIAPALFANLPYDVIKDFAPVAIAAAVPHLAGEIFRSLAGVKMVHVPYKGTGQSMQDLLGGVHLVAFDTMPAAAPHVKSGRLRAIAVSSASRVPSFPDVPTAEEAGLAGYQVTTWYGIFAPAGTPAAIVGRLHADAVKAMQTPDTRSKLEGIGADGTVSRSPAEFAALVRADTARYAKIVKDIGLKMD